LDYSFAVFFNIGSDVGERQQSHVAGALDSSGKVLLVRGAGAGRSAAGDFAAIVDISSQAGDIFIVDERNFVFAEMTDFSVSVSFKFSHFFPPLECWLKNYSPFSERNCVIVAAHGTAEISAEAGVIATFFSGIAAAATEKLNVIGNDFCYGAFLTFLGLVAAVLQPAFNENRAALGKKFCAVFASFAPDDDVKIACFFFKIAVVALVGAVYGNAEIGDRSALGSMP